MRADAARLNIQTGRHPQTREPAAMPSKNIVHIAIELSVSSWFVAARLPGADKSRLHRITGGDTSALLALIAELNRGLRFPKDMTESKAQNRCCVEPFSFNARRSVATPTPNSAAVPACVSLPSA